MSDIKIIQEHNLSLDEARQAARKVAAQMELDYEMTTTWEGDLLKFERSGVSGSLALLDKQAQLEIKLGFMLKGFASKIEEQVSKNMRKVFEPEA